MVNSSLKIDCKILREISFFVHRVTYIRALRAWKDGLGVLKYEKQRMQHKEDAWTKIHLWLDEHQQVRHMYKFIEISLTMFSANLRWPD